MGYPGMSLFCFSVYTNNTGSTKKSYELELIKGQKERGVSIFRCSESAVYSDVEVPIAPGLTTIKIFDKKGDWHFAKRKLSGTWVNTGMYVRRPRRRTKSTFPRARERPQSPSTPSRNPMPTSSAWRKLTRLCPRPATTPVRQGRSGGSFWPRH